MRVEITLAGVKTHSNFISYYKPKEWYLDGNTKIGQWNIIRHLEVSVSIYGT